MLSCEVIIVQVVTEELSDASAADELEIALDDPFDKMFSKLFISSTFIYIDFPHFWPKCFQSLLLQMFCMCERVFRQCTRTQVGLVELNCSYMSSFSIYPLISQLLSTNLPSFIESFHIFV